MMKFFLQYLESPSAVAMRPVDTIFSRPILAYHFIDTPRLLSDFLNPRSFLSVGRQNVESRQSHLVTEVKTINFVPCCQHAARLQ
jgi:hypothetical protein